jgi:hypothetical protein
MTEHGTKPPPLPRIIYISITLVMNEYLPPSSEIFYIIFPPFIYTSDDGRRLGGKI